MLYIFYLFTASCAISKKVIYLTKKGTESMYREIFNS